MPEPRHYFSPDPGVASDPREVDVLLDDVTLTLTSDAGVFSHGKLDRATRILLETAPPPPPSGTLVDLGSGYGPIALTLASRSPNARVVAVDVNERAVELTRANAERNGLANVEALVPADAAQIADICAIYSNPPIRIGKRALHELLQQWLPRLASGGAAYLVVGKNLGADSLASWLREQGYDVLRLASRGSFRVLEVRRTEGA